MIASHDHPKQQRRRHQRRGVGCIVAALIVTSSLTVFSNVILVPSPSSSNIKHEDDIPDVVNYSQPRFNSTEAVILVDNNNTDTYKKILPNKSTNGKIMTTDYSYGTTDVEEFKRFHRNYLQNISSLSTTTTTRASGKDSNGNLATTYAFASKNAFGFGAGFRNQIMALTMLVLHANDDGHDQILLDSLYHKDTYATNQFDPFDFYFDVETWNRYSIGNNNGVDEDGKEEKEPIVVDWSSYSRGENKTNPPRHPRRLPRMVLYNSTLHDQWDINVSKYRERDIVGTRPYGYTRGATRLAAGYQFYVKGKGRYAVKDDPNQNQNNTSITRKHRNPAEILMLQGALKPNPALQAVVDRSKMHLQERASRRVGAFRYMTLHARVEPDMQHHLVCKEKKVLTLQEIVDMVESKWPEPPVDVVFLPINRQYIEQEGIVPENYKNESDGDGGGKINWIAVDNLRVLNRLTNDTVIGGGMWNGTIPVVEFGSEALQGTVYEQRPSTSGSILNYFLSLGADIFVGTEVSSFSHDVLAARFYRGSVNANFKYLPGGGLHEWITDDMIAPPGFLC